MSKKKTFSYTPITDLPRVKKIKTAWDLKNLFYTSERDPRIEKDVQAYEKACTSFAKKYANGNFLTSPKKIAQAIAQYEKLTSMREGSMPGRYFWYRKELNSKDTVAEQKINLLSQRLTEAGNKILFFELRLGQIPVREQKKLLRDPAIGSYTYFLARVFLEAKHTLSESEEKILNLKSDTSYGMWVSGTEKIISNRTVTWKKQTLSLPEALAQIESLPSNDKVKLWDKVLEQLESISETAENEFNAIVTDKKISDTLRSYDAPYSATIMGYENDEESVLALVEAISTKGFALSKKFYALSAKLQKKKSIPYANKYDMIGAAPSLPFEDAVEICRDTFYGLKNEYGTFFDSMLTRGQIDVYPKAGKQGGAFMSSGVNVPSLVFLNHTDDLTSLETLAHEMGHAIHSERSKSQRPLYQSYSTTTAETASTLFEQFVEDALFNTVDDASALVMLHRQIGRDIATIQRQTAFFNFELELHTRIREQGALTRFDMQHMMQKHLQSYLGKAVDIRPKDGWSYVYIPHFRYGFYVYTYSYGLLASSLMKQRYDTDSSYIETIDTFLKSGGSATVEDIFEAAGIQTHKVETFKEALALLEQRIKRLEKLSKKVLK